MQANIKKKSKHTPAAHVIKMFCKPSYQALHLEYHGNLVDEEMWNLLVMLREMG